MKLLLLIILIFGLLILGLCMCNPKRSEKMTHQVAIRNFEFHPQELVIKKGDTVTWTNKDMIGHTATSGVDPEPDGMFNSGILNQGDSYTYTFDKSGSFDYYCIPHPFMQGTIVVD